MMDKQKFIAIALIVVLFPFLLWLIARPSQDKVIPAEDCRKVDAVITIDTTEPIHLIDTDGQNVGSIGEFDGELTVTIRRLKR